MNKIMKFNKYNNLKSPKKPINYKKTKKLIILIINNNKNNNLIFKMETKYKKMRTNSICLLKIIN